MQGQASTCAVSRDTGTNCCSSWYRSTVWWNGAECGVQCARGVQACTGSLHPWLGLNLLEERSLLRFLGKPSDHIPNSSCEEGGR